MTKIEIIADFSNFNIVKTDKVDKILNGLDVKRKKKIFKTLKFLSVDPRHPGLCTHEAGTYYTYNEKSYKLFEAYVENHTPSAWRILFCFVGNHTILVAEIIPHP